MVFIRIYYRYELTGKVILDAESDPTDIARLQQYFIHASDQNNYEIPFDVRSELFQCSVPKDFQRIGK